MSVIKGFTVSVSEHFNGQFGGKPAMSLARLEKFCQDCRAEGFLDESMVVNVENMVWLRARRPADA